MYTLATLYADRAQSKIRNISANIISILSRLIAWYEPTLETFNHSLASLRLRLVIATELHS
jgi:hypothetical protein